MDPGYIQDSLLENFRYPIANCSDASGIIVCPVIVRKTSGDIELVIKPEPDDRIIEFVPYDFKTLSELFYKRNYNHLCVRAINTLEGYPKLLAWAPSESECLELIDKYLRK